MEITIRLPKEKTKYRKKVWKDESTCRDLVGRYFIYNDKYCTDKNNLCFGRVERIVKERGCDRVKVLIEYNKVNTGSAIFVSNYSLGAYKTCGDLICYGHEITEDEYKRLMQLVKTCAVNMFNAMNEILNK